MNTQDEIQQAISDYSMGHGTEWIWKGIGMEIQDWTSLHKVSEVSNYYIML